MTATPQTESMEIHHTEGIKETIESIVIALILAFVFRAFIVEAFVIPTGSMAPTLFGAHGSLLCEDCGVEFAYGLRDLDDKRRGHHVKPIAKAVCPNCNHANTNLVYNDEERNPKKGDRILVLKWPFAFGIDLLSPSRWDVIVFKDPADGQTNFIKRLIGLPNEVLMIVDGDVYTVPTDELSEGALATLEDIRREKAEFRMKRRTGGLRAVPTDVMAELHKKMTIARKTPAAQKLLWFPVYDHDYPATTRDSDQPYWRVAREPSSGWDAASRRVRFVDCGVQDDYIELAGRPIRARNAYNIFDRKGPPIGDVRVRFVMTPEHEDAALTIRLAKLDRAFWARIRADGTVTLSQSPATSDVAVDEMATARVGAFEIGSPIEVAFENVDYRLAIRINGDEVLSSTSTRDSAAYYAPDHSQLARLRSWTDQMPRIYGEGGAMELAHVVVDRDAYYYHERRAHALGTLRWAPPGGWASPDHPILLRDDEFFMLGDNTSASKDSRLWDVAAAHLDARGDGFQLGTVPRDQLIGKAFFVYWPSGYPVPYVPRIGSLRWPFIPDVGRMRWIR